MALKREFLSTNEVAELLGISSFTIRRYIQYRKLKAVKLEGGYRIRRTDLDRFLKAREIETEEELEEQERVNERRAAARRPTSSATSESTVRRSRRARVHPQSRPERSRVRKPAERE